MSVIASLVTQEIIRRPLHEEVAEQLRQLLTEGRLPAGERLNERVLCETLKVSRTPLREAFKVLAAERLIELLPNRGARVLALAREDVAHLFEMMAELEGLSGELAARRHSAAQLRAIEGLHQQMIAAHAKGDLAAYYRANGAIHRAINRAAGNPVLTELYDSVNLRIQNLRFRSNFNRDKWDQAVAEHRELLSLLRDGKSAALRRLLERHLRNKLSAVLQEIDQRKSA